MQTEGSSNRIAYFDHLRVLAIFLIMVLHAASLLWYDTDIHSASWLTMNAYKTLTDHAVLLFVMISGALFLGRDIPVKKIFSKYVLRMAVAFVVWSIIYAVVSNYMFGIGSVIEVALASHYHLWFIPMIAGLYICLPLLRLFVRSEKTIRYFLLISFIIAFAIPAVLNLLSDFGNVTISGYLGGKTISDYAGYIYDRLDESKICMVTGYAFYFIAGYYLNNFEFKKKARIILYCLAILNLAVTFGFSVLDAYTKGWPSDTYHANFNVGVMLAAAAIFVFFKNVINGDSSLTRYGKIIRLLSDLSFGAYLIHAMVIEQLSIRLGLNALSFSTVLAVPVIAVITFAVSFALSWILNKIPFINKYIV